jgi:hypothetical protein
MPDRISFTRPAVERIADVVRAVEGARRAGGPLTSKAILGGTKPKPFKVCTFTGAWAINSAKTVTFRNVTTTPNTVSAMNLVCGLSPTALCEVSVAKDGTAWYLVQPNLTQQPGYSGSSTQLLTIVNGNLTWIGTTTVDTIVSAALGTAGLVFTRARIQVVSTASASQITIGTTACT